MGAFILFLSEQNTGENIQKASAVFEKKKLMLNKKIENESFTLLIYHKKYFKNTNLIQYDNGDFIASTGTMIFRGSKESNALDGLYKTFQEDPGFEQEIRGNYALLIFKNGRLFFFQDGLGYYPVYCDEGMKILSSSFIASVKCRTSIEISKQELYEYVLSGQYISEQTFIKQVRFTDHKHIWELLPERKKLSRSAMKEFRTEASLKEHLAESETLLNNTFSSILSAFGENMTSALSGGYDTRMILAIFRHLGTVPQLYVYGKGNSPDVKIAKEIANGENLKLEHTDKSLLSMRYQPDEYRIFLRDQFYSFDGCGSLGVFDDGTDMLTRVERISGLNADLLHINGAGGEIYREIWSVKDRDMTIDSFIRIRFDLHDFALCGSDFNKQEYFQVIKDKIRKIYGIEREWITRMELEWMFPFLRNRLAVINSSINNQFSFSLLPYMERDIVTQSYSIPVKYKEHGFYQDELMKYYDEPLSKYNSQYGRNFYDKVPFDIYLKEELLKYIPINLRPVLKNYKKTKMIKPYYFTEGYISKIFTANKYILQEYIDYSSINDRNIMSRALTAELVLQDLI